jgi:two-component system sensor histidine kinase VicK
VALAKNENLISLEAIYEESQVRFKTIFEQSKLGNKIITSDFKILKVNNALQQMLG